MANAPDTSSYIVLNLDATPDLPNARNLTADNVGIKLNDNGPLHPLEIAAFGNLFELSNFDTNGYLSYNRLNGTFAGRTFDGGLTINITNPDGIAAATAFTVVDNQTTQKVNLQLSTVPKSNRSKLNFISGDNVSISISDNNSTDSADIIISATTNGGSGGVTSVAALSNSSGIVITGSPITTEGTLQFTLNSHLQDIAELTPSAGSLIVGNGSHYTKLNLGSLGQALVSNGTTAIWQTVAGTGTVTKVNAGSNIVCTPDPIVGEGTIALASNIVLTGNITATGADPNGIIAGRTVRGGNLNIGVDIVGGSNNISATNTDGNIELNPNGNGKIRANKSVEVNGYVATPHINIGEIDFNTISSTNTNGNIILLPTGTGKVGVGTASPSAKLDVAGTSNFGGIVTYASGLAGFVDNVRVIQ